MISSVLIAGATCIASLSAALLAVLVYQAGLRPLARHLQAQVPKEAGGARGLLLFGAALNRRLLGTRYERALQAWLVQAGEPRGLRAAEILALQELGGLLGLAVGAVVGVKLGAAPIGALAFALLGASDPLLWLRGRVKKRHHQILRSLPFHLDLLTLSVEAGLDFGGALAKVVEKGKSGPLREEFQLLLKELKLGRTREEALKAMIFRVGVPALSKFATAVVLADRMGTSLGKVLRNQATQLRTERAQRAEKLASQAPVKMLFPLVTCIFPTVFLILFGPIVFAMTFGSGIE